MGIWREGISVSTGVWQHLPYPAFGIFCLYSWIPCEAPKPCAVLSPWTAIFSSPPTPCSFTLPFLRLKCPRSRSPHSPGGLLLRFPGSAQSLLPLGSLHWPRLLSQLNAVVAATVRKDRAGNGSHSSFHQMWSYVNFLNLLFSQLKIQALAFQGCCED